MRRASDVGKENDIVELEKPGMDLRLFFVDIEAGSPDVAPGQCPSQSFFVDDRAALTRMVVRLQEPRL